MAGGGGGAESRGPDGRGQGDGGGDLRGGGRDCSPDELSCADQEGTRGHRELRRRRYRATLNVATLSVAANPHS